MVTSRHGKASTVNGHLGAEYTGSPVVPTQSAAMSSYFDSIAIDISMQLQKLMTDVSVVMTFMAKLIRAVGTKVKTPTCTQ